MLSSPAWERADHRAVALVVVSSVALTTALIGIIAVFSGAVDGIGGRAPLYFLVTAVAFVALVIGFEKEALDGRTILLSTAGLSVVLGVLTVLVGEGLVYTLRHPASVLTSRLLLSLLAVGVICTGLVYWGLRHWREFLPHHPEG